MCDDTDLDDAAISPRDAGLVAYVGCDAQIVVSPAQVAHPVVPRGDFAPAARSPAWSPDGSRLASIDLPGDETTEIWTYRPDGSDARLVLTAPPEREHPHGRVPRRGHARASTRAATSGPCR